MQNTGSPIPSEHLWNLIKEEGKPISIQNGEYLYPQNMPSPGAFFIESGKVKIFRIMDNGTESILRITGEKTVFGEVSAFNGEESSPAAVALSPVKAYLLSTARMRELIQTSGEFALFIVDSLTYKVKGQSDQLGNISGKKVESRLAATICTLDYYGIPCDEDGCYSISHAELAGIIGATRPHVTAILNHFKKNGTIQLKRNRLQILSRDRLLKIAEMNF